MSTALKEFVKSLRRLPRIIILDIGKCGITPANAYDVRLSQIALSGRFGWTLMYLHRSNLMGESISLLPCTCEAQLHTLQWALSVCMTYTSIYV